MKKVFIVHAHPEPQSFNTAMVSAAVAAFERQGREVHVSDLYAMKFNPVASPADFGSRANPDYCAYALEQRHAMRAGGIAPDIRAELDKLLWCDLLVLVFPIFWYSTPAILKGWIDRVLVSGVTYGGRRIYDRGGLVGKRALVGVTLGGQPHMFGDGGIHGPLEGMLRHLLQGTLGYVGLQVLQPFVGWHIPYIAQEARGEILDGWRTRLESLENDEPYRFPSIAAYDDSLRLLPGHEPARGL